VLLEIESRVAGRLTRERRELSPAELAELRALVAGRLAEGGGVLAGTREGRGGLVLGQTLLGLGYHGWAVPVALDVETTQAGVAAYLLTAGSTFFLSYRLTRDRTVSDAHRDLSLYGGTRGILFGALAADAASYADDGAADRARLGAGVIGGLGGSLLGFLAVDRYAPDDGTAALWGAMGDVGFAAGATIAYAAGPYTSHDVLHEEFGFVESELRNRALGHAMTLSGGVVGLLAGRWLGGREAYTEGNVHSLRSAILLGAQTGLTSTRAVGTEHDRTLAAGALAGAGAGLYLGNRLLRGNRFTAGEGLLVSAGHLAGGATALGITYLLVEEIDDHPLLYLATSTVGSLLGAGLTYRALGEGSADPPGVGLRRGAARRLAVRGATLELHPESLLLAWRPGERAIPFATIRF
jgi:hypothetical protein